MVIRSIPSNSTPSKVHLRPKGDRGQQRQFVTRVNPAHIKRRVSFEITELIGLLEHFRIGQARRLHPGQDIVAGTVHHTHDAGDIIACKSFGQRLYDRDATGNGGLEPDHAASGFGRFGQRLTVVGQHRLVGGHNVLACGDRGLGRGLGGAIAAAHQFDENIHIFALGQGHGIVFPGIIRNVHAPVLVTRPGGDGGDDHGATGAICQKVGLLPDDLDDAGANGAQSGDAKAQGCCHGVLRSAFWNGLRLRCNGFNRPLQRGF